LNEIVESKTISWKRGQAYKHPLGMQLLIKAIGNSFFYSVESEDAYQRKVDYVVKKSITPSFL
jgi:hypothetical protein